MNLEKLKKAAKSKSLFLISALLSIAAPLAQARTFTVLYNFAGGADGFDPNSRLILDAQGNLWGTTLGGATGAGTIFKLAPDGTKTIIYNFSGGVDGDSPVRLTGDGHENFYGIARLGGVYGRGVIFKITAAGKERVLYNFTGTADGIGDGSLILDAKGNLYGTSGFGGAFGNGAVFKLNPAGRFTVLHSFTGLGDGAIPDTDLVMDAHGNLFGTTRYGGSSYLGTLFVIAPNGSEKVLHSFTGGVDGSHPRLSEIVDAKGNLYGTSFDGGASGDGLVFRITRSGKETTLHTFNAGLDGAFPCLDLVADAKGNLYGTTEVGGTAPRGGIVFKVTPGGKETVVYNFDNGAHGGGPFAGLARDRQGNFYGTTAFGGALGSGNIFRLRP